MEVHVEDLRGQDRCRDKLETGNIISLHHQVGILLDPKALAVTENMCGQVDTCNK